MPKSVLPPSAENALKVAVQAFEQMTPAETCRKTGAAFDSDKDQYLLPCLGGIARIGAKDCSMEYEREEQARFHLILLHYLMTADGRAPTGERMSLHDAAPTGSGWAERIMRTCIPPLVAVFGDDPDCFFRAADSLGGEKLSADTVLVPALPHVPVYITVWAKDEEFPADARILMDITLPGQLPGEDRIVIVEYTVYALLLASGKPFSMPGMGEVKG